jgi:hypothetical protein
MEKQFEAGYEESKFEEMKQCRQVIYACLVFKKENNLGLELNKMHKRN